jgi:tetratricopeptide (TPR) repeat protein
MSYQELSEQAGALRKEKKFEEALPVFEALFEQYRDLCDEFDWWGYAQSLLKLDMYERALQYAREGLLKYKGSPYLTTVYTWSLYHVRVKPERVNDRDLFFNAANAIVRLSAPDNKYSPLPDTVFRVVELLEEEYTPDYPEILTWLRKLDPAALDRQSFSFTNEEGKNIVLASDYEKYHALLVKALQESGDYEGCIFTATFILNEIGNFHYDNDLWIIRQKALALRRLARFDESLGLYLQILIRKHDWFLKMELAELYEEMRAWEKALIAALDAADDPGVNKMKVGLFMLIARVFLTLGKTREALVHARLVIALREKEGWGSDRDAEEMVSAHSADETIPEDYGALLNLARIIWAENQPKAPVYKGKISKILPHGRSGFIECEDGNSYYFSVSDFNGGGKEAAVNLGVTFVLVDSYDRAKQKPTVKAAEVKPL